MNFKQNQTKPKESFIQLQEMQLPVVDCEFSDLSSIVSVHQENEDQDVVWNPVKGDQCMNSVPIAIQILLELANQVIVQDERKDVESKSRAIKMAINLSWTTAFNNQFFSDKQLTKALTEEMRIDQQDAEIEPKAPPIDTHASLPSSKIKFRKPQYKISYDKRKTLVRRMTIVGGSPNKHRPSIGKPMGTKNKLRKTSYRRHSTIEMPNLGVFLQSKNSLLDTSRRSDRSKSHSDQKTKRESTRGKKVLFEELATQPVHLAEHYGTKGVNSSDELMENTDTQAKEELASRAIRKKYSLRHLDKLKAHHTGQGSTEELSLHQKLTQLADGFYTSDGYSKKEQKIKQKLEKQLDKYDADMKKHDTVFNHNVQALIEQEAPGHTVQKNNKFKRVLAVNDPVYQQLQLKKKQMKKSEESQASERLETEPQDTSQYKNGAFQSLTNQRRAAYSGLQPNSQKKKPPSVMSQLFRDAILRKLEFIEKRGKIGKAKLMTSKLRDAYGAKDRVSMMGDIAPYLIKNLSQKPKYKIDQNTFKLAPIENSVNYPEDQEPPMDPNSLQFDHVRVQKVKSKPDQLHDDNFFNALTKLRRNTVTQSQRALTFARKSNFAKKPMTLDDIDQVHSILSSDKDSKAKFKDFMQPVTNQNKNIQVLIINEDEESGSDKLDTQLSSIELKSDHLNQQQFMTRNESNSSLSTQKDNKQNDKRKKQHLSIIKQRGDDSENVSPQITAHKFLYSSKLKPYNKSSNKLPPIGSFSNRTLSQQSLRCFDRVKLNVKSTSMPRLLDTAQRRNEFMTKSMPGSLRSMHEADGVPTQADSTKSNNSALRHHQSVPQLKFSTVFATSSQMTTSMRNLNKEREVMKPSVRKLRKGRGTNFTDRVQIKNLELTRKLAGTELAQVRVVSTRNNHGLMNIGGGTSFNQMLEQEIKLDSTDSRLSSQFPLTPH